MNKRFIKKLILAMALVCFTLIPSISYADIIKEPSIWDKMIGRKILIIIISIVVIIRISFFILREEYKEDIKRILKKIVFFLGGIFLVLFINLIISYYVLNYS